MLTDDQIGGVSIVGDVLGPLFLFDPLGDQGRAVLDEVSSMDICRCAEEWPFLPSAEARPLLEGLAVGADAEKRESASEEYRRLFVGPFALPCPPWGSVYTDRDCVMFGDSTLALRGWMRERGIAPTEANSEPDDHIGRMLLLSSWISKEMPNELESYLVEHLLTWAPHYLCQLEEAARHPLYQSLAKLARETLLAIRDRCGLSVRELHFYR